MKTNISLWGGSLAVRIPKRFANDLDIRNGSSVDLAIEEDRLVITPIEERRVPEFDIVDLVAGVTPDNLRGEFDWGKPEGNEVW